MGNYEEMIGYGDRGGTPLLMLLTLTLALLTTNGVGAADSDASSRCDSDTEFTCSNSKCIPLSKVNDSLNDCGDNSDEVLHPCRYPLFSCRNDRCVLMEWVLNGDNDCIDGSDEVKIVGSPCHMVVNCCFCHDFIANSECFEGFCRCQIGYYSNEKGTSCLPRLIDSECRSNADCREAIGDSSCIPMDSDGDKPAGYRCACNEGFTASVNGSHCEDNTPSRDAIIVSLGVAAIGLLAIFNGFLIVWLFRAFVCRGSDEVSQLPRPVPTTYRQFVDVMRTTNSRSLTKYEYPIAIVSDWQTAEKLHVNGNGNIKMNGKT